MNDWNAWHTLLAVVRTGTFDAAASQLGVNATTVSRRVRQLEQAYGKALITRSGSRLQATATTMRLMPQLTAASEALTALVPERGQREQTARRVVRVTAVDYVCNWILARAMTLLGDESRIRLELTSDDRNLSLSRREVDFALRFAPPDANRIRAMYLGCVQYALYAPVDDDPDELNWLSFDAHHAHLPEAKWISELANNSATCVRSTSNSLELVMTMVRSGAGKSVLPQLMARNCPELVELATDATWVRPLWLLWHPSADDTEEHHVVAEWIAQATAPVLVDTPVAK